MPADLEQQLARFAEALDREAPAISFDELVGRGGVALDTTPRHAEGGEREVLIELAPAAVARRPAWRRVGSKVVIGAAAVAALLVALTAIERDGGAPGPVDVPPSTAPAPPSTATEPATSGGMWPQTTLDEVRIAQERADAGDPNVSWQVAPQLGLYEEMSIAEPGEVELVDRFLREVLGWEAYLFTPDQGGAPDGRTDGALPDLRFHRCAPGRTNPLYPPGPEPVAGELCAPTVDDRRYETVSVDLVQPDRQGRDGIWVVDRWYLTEFAQADPAAVEAQLTERLEAFLAARIAGTGAEPHVQIDPDAGAPLLYATTTGARYERYEIERVDEPRWPFAYMTFSVRLFADGGATVVEQEIQGSYGWLRLDAHTTTENGQSVEWSLGSPDGVVTLAAPSTWAVLWGGEATHEPAPWFGMLWPASGEIEGAYAIGLVDPVAYDEWCAENGGSPLLSAPAGAAEIAEELIADPDFVTTAPVAAGVGGVDAVSIDVELARDGRACGVGIFHISRWIHSLERGLRLRLYLVDLPEGTSVETLAVTVLAPEEDFEEFIEETAPIIESIELHPSTP